VFVNVCPVGKNDRITVCPWLNWLCIGFEALKRIFDLIAVCCGLIVISPREAF